MFWPRWCHTVRPTCNSPVRAVARAVASPDFYRFCTWSGPCSPMSFSSFLLPDAARAYASSELRLLAPSDIVYTVQSTDITHTFIGRPRNIVRQVPHDSPFCPSSGFKLQIVCQSELSREKKQNFLSLLFDPGTFPFCLV